MNGRCIAYLEDGRLCGRPGTHINTQIGGMVCAECARGWLGRVRDNVRDRIATRRVMWPANAGGVERCEDRGIDD